LAFRQTRERQKTLPVSVDFALISKIILKLK
jgi:hypothetical protein